MCRTHGESWAETDTVETVTTPMITATTNETTCFNMQVVTTGERYYLSTGCSTLPAGEGERIDIAGLGVRLAYRLG